LTPRGQRQLDEEEKGHVSANSIEARYSAMALCRAVVAARCFGKGGTCVYAVDGNNSTITNVNNSFTP
jgi:hypothetical protein